MGRGTERLRSGFRCQEIPERPRFYDAQRFRNRPKLAWEARSRSTLRVPGESPLNRHRAPFLGITRLSDRALAP